MLKQELVAMLGVGEDSAIMGPIEEYVQALATARELPALSVAACALRIEEAGPALRAALAQAAEGKFMTADEATLFFRGLHILGAARDRQSFQLLLRLLRCPDDALEFLLGDAVTEVLARIVVGMFDGDTGGLLAIIADRTVDAFVREALMMAAAFLTWEGRIDRDRMRDFLERFHADELADEQDFVWRGWIHAIGLLGMRELAPLVRDAWDEELIPEGLMEPDDFENDLAAAEAAPDDGGRFEAANVGYIEDAIMCLEGTAHFATSAEAASAGADGMAWTRASAEPYVNPLRNVGRNDPCPCGSGKKYKKCCLAA